MANYIKSKRAKQTHTKPSRSNPELFAWLASLSVQVKALHDELSQEKIAEKVGVKRQSITYHANKSKKEKKV